MYEIKIISDFAAAHRLRNFRGQCENLHGHNWRIEVVIRSTRLDENGMVVDFAKVKNATRRLLALIDHTYLNDIPYFQTRNPSSENIARFLYEELAKQFDNNNLWVHSVSAWESHDACATYITNRNQLPVEGAGK